MTWRLLSSSDGVIGLITALVVPLLIGATSLGVEVGHWYVVQRVMQGATDAVAISASAQYIQDQVAGNASSTAYQTVGVSYALLNGFTIPNGNVCLITASSDNCGTVRSLDPRPILCSAPPCIVVEITQNTATWLTTLGSMRPAAAGATSPIQAIPTPTLFARSVVSVLLQLTTSTTTGNSCLLALANARNAIQVRGNGDIHANCGLLIDGGRDQNASSITCSDGTPSPCGGLTLSGANAMVHITNLTVASSTTGPAESSCPDPNRCFLYNPATTVLPGSAIFPNVETRDPYASRIFTKPAGQVVTAICGSTCDGNSQGNGYTPGTQTFTVLGGTGPAAIFRATVANNGRVTGAPVLVDPGQYSALPTNPVSVTGGGGAGAKFTLTFATCFPGAQFAALPAPVPGRAYCSINLSGNNTNVAFPTGIYYIEGGELGCVGFCLASGAYRSLAGGTTFVLTNTAGGSTYAQYSITGNSVNISLVAPATNINADGSACSSGCANTTFGMLFFQDRNAPNTATLSDTGTPTSSNPAAGTTLNTLSGNASRTLSGTLYVPNQTAQFSGSGQVNGDCFGVVAKYIDDAGTPIFQNGCLPGTTGGGGSSGSVTGGKMGLAQ